MYHDPSSGAQMLEERQALFTQRYGFPSNALQSEGFLTERRLAELASELGLHWKLITPYYGLERALAPWKARLRGGASPPASWSSSESETAYELLGSCSFKWGDLPTWLPLWGFVPRKNEEERMGEFLCGDLAI